MLVSRLPFITFSPFISVKYYCFPMLPMPIAGMRNFYSLQYLVVMSPNESDSSFLLRILKYHHIFFSLSIFQSFPQSTNQLLNFCSIIPPNDTTLRFYWTDLCSWMRTLLLGDNLSILGNRRQPLLFFIYCLSSVEHLFLLF